MSLPFPGQLWLSRGTSETFLSSMGPVTRQSRSSCLTSDFFHLPSLAKASDILASPAWGSSGTALARHCLWAFVSTGSLPQTYWHRVLFGQCQLSGAGHTNPVGVSWTGLQGASLWGVAWLHAGLPPPWKPASLAHYPSLSCLSPNPTWARTPLLQTLTLQS